MKRAWLALICAIQIFSLQAADSERGEKVFEAQGCVQCHAVNGRGGTSAPDLGRRIARSYTPVLLATTMWNHAPAMWSAMRRQGVAQRDLDPESAADLFAFFSSSRFFDKPGDAGRGKQAFQQNHCAECHGIDDERAGAPPVVKWEGLAEPIALAESMWNHAAKMRQELQKRNLAWPELTAQEMSDILVYLRNLPATRKTQIRVQTTSGDRGEALFQLKGCAGCHSGQLDLHSRLAGRTLTDIAAAMWNHAPDMEKAAIQFQPAELRAILSYLWSQRLLDDGGNARRGEKVFAAKQCSACHEPNFRKREHTSLTMISSLWSHGPAMLERMKQKGIQWPRLSANDMSDLIAFLNSKRPAP